MPRIWLAPLCVCICLGCGTFAPWPPGAPHPVGSHTSGKPTGKIGDLATEQTELARLERELHRELSRMETSAGREQDAWEIAAGAPRRATLKAQIQRQKQRVELARKAQERRAAEAETKEMPAREMPARENAQAQ